MSVNIADDSNFKEQITANSKVIVKFFADWCGSCKLFSPKFKRLAGDERFKDVVFLDVNAEKNPDARKVADVKNLPTFAVFINGELVDSVCTTKEEGVVELLEKLS